MSLRDLGLTSFDPVFGTLVWGGEVNQFGMRQFAVIGAWAHSLKRFADTEEQPTGEVMGPNTETAYHTQHCAAKERSLWDQLIVTPLCWSFKRGLGVNGAGWGGNGGTSSA